MSHDSNGNGNGVWLKILLGITLPLAVIGIAGAVVMYGKLSSIQTAQAAMETRLTKMENDIYTPRFSRAKSASEDNQRSDRVQ